MPSPRAAASAFTVCFVCTGNICRSPMAEVVLRTLAERAGLGDALEVTSAGTGEWHLGEHADDRAVAALERRGYDGTRHRARLFDTARFDELDVVIALDHGHERALRSWASTDADRQKVRRLLDFAPGLTPRGDVPDPYYSDDAAFDTVLTLIETATERLFRQIEPGLRKNARPQPEPADATAGTDSTTDARERTIAPGTADPEGRTR